MNPLNRAWASAFTIAASPIDTLLNTYAGPAFIFDGVGDVLAFNPMADRLYGFSAEQGPFARNMVFQLFMNPTRRRLYADYEPFAQAAVAFFRLNAAPFRFKATNA